MPRANYHVSLTANLADEALKPPYQDYYPVLLSGGAVLKLPIQPLPGGEEAIALLMSNQTPFAVEHALASALSTLALEFQAEVVVGIPTLGLDYARLVARDLGFTDYVALGNSRKFWYSDAMSVPVHSVTSPGTSKRLFLDPMLIERVAGKRALVIDDVINTGGSAVAAIELLQSAAAIVVGLCVVLVEGDAWREPLARFGGDWPDCVRGLGNIPMFRRGSGGWLPVS